MEQNGEQYEDEGRNLPMGGEWLEDIRENLKEMEKEKQRRELEERLRMEQEEMRRKMRPRWPKIKGARPDIEWSMKKRLQKLARKIMKEYGMEGKKVENELMETLAKGLVKEGLQIFEPQKKLHLKSLGQPVVFKDDDSFEESDDSGRTCPDDEEEEGKKEHEFSFFNLEEGHENNELNGLDIEGGIVREIEENGIEEKEIEEEAVPSSRESDDSIHDENIVQIEDLSEDEGGDNMECPRFQYYDLEPEGRCFQDVYFQQTSKASSHIDKVELERQRRLKKRKICRLTLVRVGETEREDLGYTDGWTETNTSLSLEGRKSNETAAINLMKRGYKFDMAITSVLKVARETMNLVLSATGQDSLRRYTAWEMNPRHLGNLEGETTAGTASAWGWLPAEYWAFQGPPPLTETHPEWYRQVEGDTKPTASRTVGETVIHVVARTKVIWDFIQHLFLRRGKRSILVVGHGDSLKGILYHGLDMQPTDFSHWEPSSSVPMVLAFQKKEENIGLTMIDFITNSREENKKQVSNFSMAMLERHIDSGLLDKYSMMEMKRRMDEGLKIPTIEDIYRFKRREAYKLFEKNAKDEGKKERMIDGLISMYDNRLPQSEAQQFYNRISGLDSATYEETNMSVKDRVAWIERYAIGVNSKLRHLEQMLDSLPPQANVRYRDYIKEKISIYKDQIKEEKKRRKQYGSMLKKEDEEQPKTPWKCLEEAVKRGLFDGMPISEWKMYKKVQTEDISE